jgi:hypothetical protein
MLEYGAVLRSAARCAVVNEKCNHIINSCLTLFRERTCALPRAQQPIIELFLQGRTSVLSKQPRLSSERSPEGLARQLGRPQTPHIGRQSREMTSRLSSVMIH